MSAASSVSTATAQACQVPNASFCKKIEVFCSGKDIMHMNVDQNTTIQNLMSAVQKERDVHPAWQQPTYLGKNLLTMPLNTKLVTLDFDAYPDSVTRIVLIKISRCPSFT